MKKNYLNQEATRLKTALQVAGIHSEDSTLSLVEKVGSALQEKGGALTVDEIVTIKEQNESAWEYYNKEIKEAEEAEKKEPKGEETIDETTVKDSL